MPTLPARCHSLHSRLLAPLALVLAGPGCEAPADELEGLAELAADPAVDDEDPVLPLSAERHVIVARPSLGTLELGDGDDVVIALAACDVKSSRFVAGGGHDVLFVSAGVDVDATGFEEVRRIEGLESLAGCSGGPVFGRLVQLDQKPVTGTLLGPDGGTSMGVLLADLASGLTFELYGDLDELHALAALDQASGLASGWSGPDDGGLPLAAPPAEVVPLVVGGDDRVPVDNSAHPRRTIGAIETKYLDTPQVYGFGKCSGGLVGPRHVLTAAHCIYESDVVGGPRLLKVGEWWFEGQADVGDDVRLLGAGPTQVLYPVEYASWSGSPNDWAVVIINERQGDSLGWMGWWYEEWSGFKTRWYFNRAYASCSSVEGAPPPNCKWPQLYGAPSSMRCDTDKAYYVDVSNNPDDGWSRVADHDCDTNGGSSGSPIYHYRNIDGEYHYVISGIHLGWSSQGDLPNEMRRITPVIAQTLHVARQYYP